jgi:hypothetical protein
MAMTPLTGRSDTVRKQETELNILFSPRANQCVMSAEMVTPPLRNWPFDRRAFKQASRTETRRTAVILPMALF